MSEMIERACKANFLRCNPGWDPDKICPGNTEPDWTVFRDAVRCTIEAMREPTDAMVTIGDREFYEWMPPEKEWTRPLVLTGWRAMIDEALK